MSLLKKTLRWLLWIVGGVLILFLLAIFLIRLPAVQNFITQKAIGYLEDEIQTEVRLDRLYVGFPKSIVVEEFYMEDQHKDTLVDLQSLTVDMDMWALWNRNIEINSLDVSGLNSNIYTDQNGNFNYQYIIDAFSSPQDTAQTSVAKDTAAGMNYELGEVHLSNISLNYIDRPAGTSLEMKLGNLKAAFDAFSPLKNRYHLDHIQASNTDVAFEQTRSSANEEEAPLPDLDLAVGEITLDKINARYASDATQQSMKIALGHLNVQPDRIDLNNQRIAVGAITLNESDLVYVQDTTRSTDTAGQKTTPQDVPSSDAAPWTVSVNSLNGSNNAFRYENHNRPRQAKGIDYNHLYLTGLDFAIREILYDASGGGQSALTVAADIQNMQGREQSGFILESLNSTLEMDASGMKVQELQLKTPHTLIDASAKATYPTIEALTRDLSRVDVDLKLEQSTLGFRDLLYFDPSLKAIPPVASRSNGSIRLKSTTSGPVDDLTIKNLRAEYGTSTQLQTRGKISGLPEVERVRVDLKVPVLSSSNREIRTLLPAGTIPETMRLPETFSASARLTGGTDDFDAQIDLSSSMGAMEGTAHLSQIRGKTPSYSSKINFSGFELGTLLQDSLYGATSGIITVEGSGFDPDQMNARLSASIDPFSFKGYSYRNLNIHSSIKEQQVDVEGSVQDSNLILHLDAGADLDTPMKAFQGEIRVEGSDLQALELVQNDYRGKGVLSFELQGTDPDSLKGAASLTEGLIIKNKQRYPIDSMHLAVNTMDSLSEFELFSDFLTGKVKGNVDPGKFAGVFKHHIDHYLSSESNVSEHPDSIDQQFTFEFTVDESTVLTDVFLPALEKIAPGNISGSYDSEKHDMKMNGYFPRIIYSGTTIDSLNLSVRSDPETMDFNIRAQSVYNPTIRVDNPLFAGTVQNRTLDVRLDISEDTSYQNILLRGKLSREDSTYLFRFNQNGFVLDDESWNVPSDHHISFGPSRIKATNEQFNRGEKTISVQEVEKDAIKFSFEQFSLQDVSQALKNEEELLTGQLNGELLVQQRTGATLYDADLNLSNLKIQEAPIGDLSLKINNKDPDKFTVDAQLSGNNNDVSITGNYERNTQGGAMDIRADLNRLQMKSIQPFTTGELKNMTGYLSGQINLKGSAPVPEVDGQLHFNSVSMRVTQLNTRFQLTDEVLSFDNDQLVFNNFTIQDSMGNDAELNGSIAMDDFSDPRIKIDAMISDFHLMDKEDDGDALFFGSLILNSDIKIRGSLSQPNISADTEVLSGSDLSLIFPTEDPDLETSGGIDEFIDRDRDPNPIMNIEEKKDSIVSEIKNLDLSANVSIGRESEIKIYLDQGRGNYLKVRGEAELIFSMDPSGTITLTGRYQIYDGEYQLLFRNVVRRAFDLKEGSSIVWSGDPLKARVNLTAVHTKEAEPLGLVQGQLASGDQESQNRFRQSLPFQIVLTMKEELTAPYIDFDITLPPRHQSAVGGQVQARLNQLNQNESAVNKQVFSLLVLGRFVPDDPVNTAGGGRAEGAARRSVSKLLNAQLDRFSDKFVKGVDLNLELESYQDYSSGDARGRTELNIGLDKAFFNERLTVSVGGDVDLEGGQRRNQNAGDLLGDLSVEYALTENGNWKLRAFRKDEYEGVIDGDIIKTGTSIIFSKDYNTLSELFDRESREKNTKTPEQE